MSDTIVPSVAGTALDPGTVAAAPRRTPWWRPYLPVVVFAAVLTVLPFIGLSNRHIHLAVVCLIWTIAAYGLFVPYAFAGQMTVAIVTAWGVGAYATGIAIKYWDWTFVPCVLLSIGLGFLAGMIMALPILRTKGHYFVIITFVIAEAVTVAANNWDVTSGAGGGGMSVSQSISLFGIDFGERRNMYYLCLALAAIVAIGVTWLRGSRFGKHLASVRENEELARSIGIRTTWLKIVVLGVGGGITGLAGTLYAYYLSHIAVNEFGVNRAITLILIVVVGGRMSVLGPFVGAAIAYYLPELIDLDPNRVLIAYGLALGVIVILLPTGVIGGIEGAFDRIRRRRRTPTTEVAS